MSILSGQLIRKLGIINTHYPRTEVDLGGRKATFGESAAGYDIRVEWDGDGEIKEVVLAPGAFILASSVEEFAMPDDVVGMVHDKSSWARRGLTVQNTVIEPGWNGYLTLELTNHSHLPILLKRKWPIAQIVFHTITGPVIPYAGKYQHQKRGPQEAK